MSKEQNKSETKANPVDAAVISPCPFCGHKNENSLFCEVRSTTPLKTMAFKCEHCEATGPAVFVEEENTNWEETATEEWNKRAT